MKEVVESHPLTVLRIDCMLKVQGSLLILYGNNKKSVSFIIAVY